MRKLICGAIVLAMGCATSGRPPGSVEIDGSVVDSDSSHVVLRTSPTETLDLAVTGNTHISREGLVLEPRNLSLGEEVRATYQITDGRLEALRILAVDELSQIPRTY